MSTSRRGFLKLLTGAGLVSAVAPSLLLPEEEPVRRFWQVGRNAPVRGGRWHVGDITEIRINGRAFSVKPGAHLEFGDFPSPIDDQVDALAYARRSKEPMFDRMLERSIVGDSHYSSASVGYVSQAQVHLHAVRALEESGFRVGSLFVEQCRHDDFVLEVLRDPVPGAPNALRDIAAAMRSFWSRDEEDRA